MSNRSDSTSAGGKTVRARKPKETNTTRCPTCGAGAGQRCIKDGSGGKKFLHRTHRSPVKVPSSRAGHIKHAFKVAADLGPIIPVPPARVHVADGSPILGPGQVYVMRSGTVFHPVWCSFVAEKWDAQPAGLLVIAEDTVGGRTQCSDCKDPLAV